MTFIVFLGAIGSGIVGTLFTRASRGFTRWAYGAGAIVAYSAATIALAWLLQHYPAGVVYAVWSGTAAAILVAIDRVVFRLAVRPLQYVGMLVTLVGVALLASVIA